MFPFWNDYYYLIIVAQIICILHALKTGRRDWLYLLIFLPAVGAIIYFIREMLPDITSGHFLQNLQRALFSGSNIKDLERKVRISDTVTNKLNLAAAYAGRKEYGRAAELAKSCLSDLYTNDPAIMLDVARYSFLNEQYDESVMYFDKALALKNNRLERPEDELIYARALEMTGNNDRAEEVFKKVIRVDHSFEAMYYYGMMLKKLNRNQEAGTLFQQVQDEKDLHPRYVRRRNAQWVRASRRELAGR